MFLLLINGKICSLYIPLKTVRSGRQDPFEDGLILYPTPSNTTHLIIGRSDGRNQNLWV